MGFRSKAYCTVWSVNSVSDTMTNVRLSITRKNKHTGDFEQEFSGFVGFVGSANAKKAASLKEKDRIQLGDVDVTNKYDKEKGVTYTNFKVFSFDMADEAQRSRSVDENAGVDSGEPDDLPF